MNTAYIISGHCNIVNGQARLNGSVVYEGIDTTPEVFLPELYKKLNVSYPKFYKMDPLCKLGFLASEILLNGRNLTDKYPGDAIGMILYNAAGSIDSDRNHQQSIQSRDAYFPSPSVFVYTLANIVIGEISIRNKFFGESTFFIENAFNASSMETYIRQMLDEGVMDCCLCGWLEMNGNHYHAVLYLIEKSTPDNKGIAIFEPGKLTQIYSQGI